MAAKPTAMQEQKARLRRQFRQFRDALDSSMRADHDRAIFASLQLLPELLAAKSVFCYISSGSEVDTRALLGWLLDGGKQVVVPKIAGDGRMLAIGFAGWDGLQSGMHGIPAPISSTPFAGSIDVCITPGIAFTPDGIRLGQGQGYYDRWFAAHTVRHRIAPAYECQIAPRLPADAHDCMVDMIVTEQRTIRVS